MATHYSLPCQCGAVLRVTAAQAGERISCECGAEVEAPTLRQLRELPLAEPETAASGAWGASQGVLAAGAVIVLALLAGAGWLRLTEPAEPTPFDAVARQAAISEGLDQMAPADVWRLWRGGYAQLLDNGFEVFEMPGAKEANARIAQSRAVGRGLLIGAGAVLVVTLGAYAVTASR